MSDKFNLVEILRNISDNNLYEYVINDFYDYVNTGNESSYNNFLLKLGYDVPINSVTSNNHCINCDDRPILIYDHLNNYYFCDNCHNITYTYDYNPDRLKKYPINPSKKNSNTIKKFNYSLSESEQLTNDEIDELINIYFKIKNIITDVTGRKYNFKYDFFITRVFFIIGKQDLNKHIDFSLCKSTYNKYLIQWFLICSYLNFSFDGMTDIKIKKYPNQKYKHK